MPLPDPLPPHMNPMSAEEVDELLSACLQGPLPHVTVQRLMATVCDWGPVIARQCAELGHPIHVVRCLCGEVSDE